MNRENLEKLAYYLHALPDFYQHFHMGNWNQDHMDDHKYGCCTVACAVGHGVYAGFPIKEKEFWHDYSYRVFLEDSEEWKWCFSAAWEHTDNTTKGAAKRILYMLDRGVPEDYASKLTEHYNYSDDFKDFTV